MPVRAAPLSLIESKIMTAENGSWTGASVRHTDGRVGTVSKEFLGFGFRALTLAIEGSDATEHIQLNVDGLDSGASGWSWRASAEGAREVWHPLGLGPIKRTRSNTK